MKALGIAFSARKRGNCLNSLEYALAKLKAQKFETEIINIYDHDVRPCSVITSVLVLNLEVKMKNARYRMMSQRFTKK